MSMPTGQTDRQTDVRPLHYAFRCGRGQRNKLSDIEGRSKQKRYRQSFDGDDVVTVTRCIETTLNVLLCTYISH